MATAFLNDIARLLTPPPPFTSPEYDGLEYRWKMLVFRPALFKVEAFILVGVALYFVFFFLGKSYNKRRAEAWLNANYSTLEAQFSKPTTTSGHGLISDGFSDFFNFSTGRKNVASLHAILSLLPRQDLAVSLYRAIWSFIDLTAKYEDVLELDFKLARNTDVTGFVWGIVAKDCVGKVKNDRWDLTLTKTSESPLLGPKFMAMTEYADVNEAILKNSKIAAAVSDPAIAPYFKSLSITDQPRERPNLPIPAELRSRHLIVSLRLPPASAAGVTSPLIKACLSLIDQLESSRITFKPETRTKLRKTREEITENIRKEAEAEKREEAEEERVREKKRKEDERLSKLSAAEQKKEMEKERKRAMKKAQGRVVKK